MSSSLLITLEMAGVVGVVLLLGGWELWTLRRDKAREKPDTVSREMKTPDGGRHATDSSQSKKSPGTV